MRRRFMIKTVGGKGKAESHPMKEWLRNNPQDVPPGINPSKNTSHEIRNALKKQGWDEEQTDTEVILTRPVNIPNTSFQIDGKQAEQTSLPKMRQVIGNMGLYYVCYQLSRLGWNVMPTARNARGVDIIAYNRDCSRFIGVQVKALSKRDPVPLGANLNNIIGDFWIIVNNLANTPAAFVMLPKEVLNLAHRGEKDGRISYWLQPASYNTEVFVERWDRIGHGDDKT
jgi:hypothetical protein